MSANMKTFVAVLASLGILIGMVTHPHLTYTILMFMLFSIIIRWAL
jgi:hypothetical protein